MSTFASGVKPRPPQTTTIGLLLLGGVLAALWVGINLVFPGLAPTGIPSVVTRLGIHFAILAGLWLGLLRTEFSASKRVILWLGVALPLTVWLAVIWNLALNGVFQPIPGVARLPRLPIAIFAPVIIGLAVLLRSKSVAAFLDATPASWLIALQVYRIFGGIFLVNWANGAAPGAFAWPAGIGDMLTGITALPVAFLLASGAERGRSAALTWNTLRVARFHGGDCHGHSQHTGAAADIRPGYPGLAGGHLPCRADFRVRRPELDPAACAFNPATPADWDNGG